MPGPGVGRRGKRSGVELSSGRHVLDQVKWGCNTKYVRASEETKEVWKWSAIPRTMSAQAATMAAPQKKFVSYRRESWTKGIRTKKGGTKDVEDGVHGDE